MSIDYEKSFKKLVEQIKKEYEWAEEDYQSMIWNHPRDGGIRFAYKSMKEFAEKLEKGEFDFEKDV